MKTFRFNLKKPFSSSLLVQTAVDDDRLSVQYFMDNDKLINNSFENFSAKKSDVMDCCMRWRLYVTKLDVLIFLVCVCISVWLIISQHWIQMYTRSTQSWETVLIIFAAVLIPVLFVVFKLATVLEIQLANGSTHDIPVSAFVWYPKKQDKRKVISDLVEEMVTWAILAQIKKFHEENQCGTGS